jgi:hypothetical protein
LCAVALPCHEGRQPQFLSPSRAKAPEQAMRNCILDRTIRNDVGTRGYRVEVKGGEGCFAHALRQAAQAHPCQAIQAAPRRKSKRPGATAMRRARPLSLAGLTSRDAWSASRRGSPPAAR